MLHFLVRVALLRVRLGDFLGKSVTFVGVKVYVFNPENDMALGCGRESYNAPGWARQLRRDLELVMCWLAEPGSMVLVNDATRSQAWIDAQELDVKAIEPRQLRMLSEAEVVPWGWSMPLCKELLLAGLSPSLLPTPDDMERVRQLAHRRTSIAIHQAIRELCGCEFSPIPIELSDCGEVVAWAKRHPGCYVKTPWSGSGRGVYRAVDAGTHEFERWVGGAIARQGSVLCEVGLDKVLDFALEFRCEAGASRLAGYSVFRSDSQNQYGHGMVAPSSELRCAIAGLYPEIDVMVEVMQRAVEQVVAPHYNGFLGVDMLLYREGDELKIDPCVEVNLRCTMGLVASVLGERHGMRGELVIASAQGSIDTLTPVYSGTRSTLILR